MEERDSGLLVLVALGKNLFMKVSDKAISSLREYSSHLDKAFK
jgi:hypothetical protein